jgi:hypothetical protein
MDDIRQKQSVYLVVSIEVIVLVLCGIVFRVDIEVAMKIVESAWKYPEDSIWVEYATEYLIWSEHPSTYQRLKVLFWDCRNFQEWPGDPPDYTAIQAAYILGSYQDEEAYNVLTELVTFNYVPDGPPHCVKHVYDALVLKGQEGYDFLLMVALGEVIPSLKMRCRAIRKLGESQEPKYIDALVQIGNEPFEPIIPYPSPMKITVIEALETIGTEEALEAIEWLSQ